MITGTRTPSSRVNITTLLFCHDWSIQRLFFTYREIVYDDSSFGEIGRLEAA